MNDTKLNLVPYILFLNDKGEGFTLNRQYKLQHENIGGYKGIRRDCIEALKPLALRSEVGYPLTDKEAIPEWCRRFRRVKEENANLCTRPAGEFEYYLRSGLGRSLWDAHSREQWTPTEFTAYWFDQDDEKVQEAYCEPQYPEGTTLHFDKVSHIQEEIKGRKAEQRAEITKQYREEFRIRKPFFSGGSVRICVLSDDRELENACTNWNDYWWESDSFSLKDLRDAIKHFIKNLDKKDILGKEKCQFHFHLEGTYRACASFEEAENGEHEPWGDYWEVNHIATVVV